MTEAEIRSFWQEHPCGETLVGGVQGDYRAFFDRYDRFRYDEYPELLKVLDGIGFAGKRVLEIGLGEGADAEQIIRRGALWTGVDLTAESVSRVKTRLETRGLKYEALKQGSALALPFESRWFDKVYSCGVLHHIPDVRRAQDEIHRVLKPDGELVAMVYAKVSLNYFVSIAVLRRLALAALYVSGVKLPETSKTGQHLKLAREQGLLRYLRMPNFLSRNTDGPLNPYSKVYTTKEVEREFPRFRVTKSYKNFMHAPPLPVHRCPFGNLLGWCLWVHLTPR